VDRYPAAAEFARRFEARFGKKAESFSLYAYDAANVILRAIDACLRENGRKFPSRRAVCEAVRKSCFAGITGQIEFDNKGDRKKADYYVMMLKESAYPGTPVKVISAAPPGN
jgi:branched-chain amino acid transport system substrate-binding protein